MTEGRARWVIGAITGALALAGLLTDLPARAGAFWSDGATYYCMAWSLAEDLDLEYELTDVARTRREFPEGPQGIFIKRSHGGLVFDGSAGFPWLRRLGEEEKRIYFAKSFAYPVVAAPFVWLLGTPGLLVTNALWLGLALYCGYRLLRRRGEAPLPALAFVLVLLLATVTPLYLVWPQPEILNVGLIAAGLLAGASGRPVLAALLLGYATYSKPTNVFLALPLGVEPLLRRPGSELLRGLLESLRRGAVLAGVVAACYGASYLVTGEVNYQGGERKTFHGPVFPYETPEVTFGNSGFWMTTNEVGPLVEGRDEDKIARGSGPPLAVEELRGAFFANLGYFWIGRYAGAAAYFAPVILAALLFLFMGPRDTAGWLGLASLVSSYLFYIWLIPANWYGGGGTLGNRYFLNLVPLGALMLPVGRSWLAGLPGLLAGAVYLGPVLASPLWHSLHPGRHAARGPYRVFPIELTMLNDLSFCIEGWRCRRSIGDTVGDLHKHWPADPKAYFLYFPDDGTVAADETIGGVQGFRVRRGERAEVVLRALEPIRTVTISVDGGQGGDLMEVEVDGRSDTLLLGPGQRREARFSPERGLLYYDTFLHVLRFRSRGAVSATTGDGAGGSFVSVRLDVSNRPR